MPSCFRWPTRWAKLCRIRRLPRAPRSSDRDEAITPNQVNNVLAFPGIFRGALDVRASDINEAMKVAAAQAIASLVDSASLCATYIVPDVLDKRVLKAVAAAVAQAAKDSGVARI